MKPYIGGSGNRPAPLSEHPKQNKVLLVINIVLCLASIGLAVGYYCYSDYELTVCMLLVALVTGYNVFMAWRTLRSDRKK